MGVVFILKRVFWVITCVIVLYSVFLLLLLNVTIQRHALYAHKVNTAWWHDVSKPEQWGFLKNQVQPFRLSTPDGESLYAWHILPIKLYTQNEQDLISQPSGVVKETTNSRAFRLLSEDLESRLVISFHGNAGTVAQGWRTESYRAISAAGPDRTHVLTVDYRGFGHSTGFPTEQGLILDGITLVLWALEVAKVPAHNIVIMGQSLGTAVATAVVEHFTVQHQVEFAGVVLVAAFSDLPTLMLTYSAGGIVPILFPLGIFPQAQRALSRYIKDTWQTRDRLANLTRKSKKLDLVLIHAQNDYDIPWTHSNTLFHAAANATSKDGMVSAQIDGVKNHVDLGLQGWMNLWAAGSGKDGLVNIRQIVLRYGGHNRVMTYDSVSKAVFDLFML